ncbi:MAG: sensor histidine kinase [Rhodocyclaceae bacterium]|nr:sensor histidine kinase [Rhodocyclaceae bacterium]
MSRNLPAALLPNEFDQAIDLKKVLIAHVTVFAIAIGVVATGLLLAQAVDRVRAHVLQTGGTLERLISEEVTRPQGSFQFSLDRLDGLELKSISAIGELLGICVEVKDIYAHPVVARCFGGTSVAPSAVRWALARMVSPETRYQSVIEVYPGVAVGELAIIPNLDNEAWALWGQIRVVIGMTFGILLLNLLIYLPVRRVLRPTEQILGVIARMQAGDIAARMPRPSLLELRRIAVGFDHLAERLQATLSEQRQLAQRLISAREEERRHLAHDLHDEFGQLLASIAADAAFLAARIRTPDPELLPAVQSIASVTARMMEGLQGILCQLRPQGLDEFGLRAGLVHLIDGWRRRLSDCRLELNINGEIDDLPDDLSVSLYRIVQESLTNALRHGAPENVVVRLTRECNRCAVSIEDDGSGGEASPSRSRLGVLGMKERVAALGGSFAMTRRSPRGVRVQAEFPAEAMVTHENSDA